MKSAIVVLLLVFSFSAHSAKESSAVERLQAIPPDEAKCEAGKKEYGDWKLAKAPIPKEKVPRAIELLNGISVASPESLEVIRTALKEDPAGALPFYFTHSNCGMLRRHLASKLILHASLSTTSTEEKTAIKTALKNVLLGQKYEMFIEAMIDAAVLAEIYDAKLFTEGSGATEKATLKKLKTKLSVDARSNYPKEMTEHLADHVGSREMEPKKYTELIRKNPKYDKYKDRWIKETEISGHALTQLRELAAKLN